MNPNINKENKENKEKKNNYNEVKNLKFKTMMSNNQPSTENKVLHDLAKLDKFLENEKIYNSNEPWSKLDKTTKLKKLYVFANTYKTTNELTNIEYDLLIAFFKDCLDKKKLHKVNDVLYNKETGEIKNIPMLFFNKSSNHFTLKSIDKRASSLRGLAPKKKQGTIKNISV
jgi:hypothetical protein